MSAPRPTVQLLHTLADGSHHVDWMIAQDPRGEAPLVTFRLDRRLDDLDHGERLDAARLADHRPRYLRYEGPISGGRGSVRRLARGVVVHEQRHAERWELVVRWEGGPEQRLRLDRRASGDWVIAGEPPAGESA